MDKTPYNSLGGEHGKPLWPEVAHHEVLKQIGCGSYGEVWLARNLMGAYRAIKVVRRSKFDSDRPYQREFEGLRHFEPVSRTHDGLIDILDVGQNDTGGYFYYVMEAADDLVAGQNISPDPYQARTLSCDLVLGNRLPFSKCLEIALSLAASLGHLHRNGLVHRDIKPSNIIFVNGITKLADIGLVTTSRREATFIGAPGYIPPEGPGRPQGDVYALGKVIYEMMSGRDRLDFPHAPRDLEPTEFEDFQELNSIVLKACERDPSRRYPSAVELHADLIVLQSGKSVRRLRRRERRLKAAVSTMTVAALAALGGFVLQQIRAHETEARNRILRQGQLITDAQLIRLSPHSRGWSQSAWTKVAEASKLSSKESSRVIRDQAAAVLAGLDASMENELTNAVASFLRFDATGKRLLLGMEGRGARVWNGRRLSDPVGVRSGLAAGFFDNTGLPVQLGYDTNQRVFTLSNVSSQNIIRQFAPGFGSECGIAQWDGRQLLALSSDGTRLAVVCSNKSEFVLAIWDSRSNHSIALTGAPPSAICTDAAGRIIVVGNSAGELKAWHTEDWSSISLPRANRDPICSLALHRMDLTSESLREFVPGRWFLAAGDSGSGLRIWDVATGVVISQCRGIAFAVTALAFSPDGTLLASGGVSSVILWDAMTGFPLISLRDAHGIGAIQFSPSGRDLAVSVLDPFTPHLGLQLWKLDNGRGILTLRGMSARITRISFSPSGKYLAGLSHDWQVGVWETVSGQLVHLIEAPPGELADNAALTFGPTDDDLAYSANGNVRLWHLSSGKTTNLPLTPGWGDELCYAAASDRWLLFRAERRPPSTWKGQQSQENPKPQDAPVFVLRNILGKELNVARWEVPASNERLLDSRFAAGGRFLILASLRRLGSERKTIIRAIDTVTMKELWSKESNRTRNSDNIVVDPHGGIAATRLEDGPTSVVIDPASSGIKRTLPRLPMAIAPGGSLYALDALVDHRGCPLFDDKLDLPLVTLDIDSPEGDIFQFDRTGNLLAWYNKDCTVTLCNLAVIHKRLAEVGLAW